MNGLLISIGLHLTKCAGTSLISTLRRNLTEDAYFFGSSYYENFISSRPMFSELRDLSKLTIYFGHFAHEFHIGAFSDRPQFRFTGVRDPVERAISALRHDNAIRAAAGSPLNSVEAFLTEQKSTMCGEILRAFPSLAARYPDRVEAALAALSTMDFIYSTSNFEEDAQVILEKFDMSAPIVPDNIASSRLESDQERELAEECKAILAANAAHWLGEDIRLYEAISPYVSRTDLKSAVRGETWALDIDAFRGALPSKEECLERLAKLEIDYFSWEAGLLRRQNDIERAFRREIDIRNAIMARMKDMFGAPADGHDP